MTEPREREAFETNDRTQQLEELEQRMTQPKRCPACKSSDPAVRNYIEIPFGLSAGPCTNDPWHNPVVTEPAADSLASYQARGWACNSAVQPSAEPLSARYFYYSWNGTFGDESTENLAIAFDFAEAYAAHRCAALEVERKERGTLKQRDEKIEALGVEIVRLWDALNAAEQRISDERVARDRELEK